MPLKFVRQQSVSSRVQVLSWIVILSLAWIRFFGPLHYDAGSKVRIGPEAIRIAHELYKNGAFANPYFPLKTGPTAHAAPAYPAMVAGLFHLFGEGAKGEYAFQLAEALILTAEIAMFPLLAQALGANIMVGFIAAILAIPGLGRDWHLEGNLVALLMMMVTLLACKYLRVLDRFAHLGPAARRKLRLLQSPAALATFMGFLWGAIILSNPSGGLVWASWLIVGGWYSWQNGIKRACLPALIIPILMIAPWTWRNYHVLHGLVPMRSDLGLELMVSNNDCAVFSLPGNEASGCFGYNHPNASRVEAAKVKDLGEVKYNQIKRQRAIVWIKDNPGHFLKLTSQRFLYFWLPTATGNFMDTLRNFRNHASPWVVYLVTLFSIPGIVVLWRSNPSGAFLCGSVLALYPTIYYFVAFDYRYRYPIIWVSFLLGSVAIWSAFIWCANRLKRRRSQISAATIPIDQESVAT